MEHEHGTGAGQLRVLVTGEDPLARSALSDALRRVGTFLQVTQQEPSALDDVHPDVLLLDLGLAGREGLETLRSLHGVAPVVALVSREDLAAEAWASGAAGVLLRSAPASAIAAGLTAASEGLAVLDRALVSVVATPIEADGRGDETAEELTPREREVLTLLASGLSNKEIGARLGISEHTAKFHVNAILGKLSVQRRTEAVVRAARLGLISL